MSMNLKLWGAMALAVTTAVGCGETNKPTEAKSAGASSAPEVSYVSAAEPADARGVGEARKSSDKEVTVVGRIGGSEKPFVDGVAAFTIVDPSVPPCGEDEGCPTPWDYCCTQDEVKENIAMVKIVDAQGKPLMKDAKGLLGVKELSTVVVQGKAQRDEAGNLTVLAEKVHVKKEQ